MANQNSGTLSVIATASETVAATIATGASLTSISISSDGARVCSTAFSDNTVVVLGGASSPAAPTSLVATPAAPTALVATPGQTSVSLAFTPGANGGSPITKYQYRVGAGAWTDAIGTTSPITISGLTNHTSPQIRLRAVNAVGTSGPSSMVATRLRYAAPTISSAVASSNGRITVTFTGVTPVGATMTGYLVVAPPV